MNSLLGTTKRISRFKYLSPSTLAEAVFALKKYDGKAKLLAGGTDLVPNMKRRIVAPEYVIDLKSLVELNYVRKVGRELRIGPLTTIFTIGTSAVIRDECPALFEATKTFATVTVRNMATIGGNICRSSPAADTVPPLMIFDAELKLVGSNGERRVRLEDFVIGAGLNILDNEILTEIIVPLKDEKSRSGFTKLTRNSSDLAKINCAARVVGNGNKCGDIKIVLGAVADRPVRAKSVEQTIKGHKIDDELIERASREVTKDIAPISDARSTAEYRTQISKVLVARLIKQIT